MCKIKYVITALLLALGAAVSAQQPFTAGNIVVYRIGDGTTLLSSAAAPVFLDEYTPAGVLIQSIAMPSAAAGSNNILTAKGNELNGMLTLSANGKYLVVPGSIAPPGTVPSGTTVTIGLVDYNAHVNTSTAITDVASSNGTLYTAASDDGKRLWFSRFNAIRYCTIGSTTSTVIGNSSDFNYALTIANGQLYAAMVVSPRIRTVGTGLPVTGLQSLVGLPGFGSASARVPIQFAFADLDAGVPGVDVLYIADNRNDAGLRKLSLVGGVWVDNGLIGPPDAYNYIGLAISVSGTSVKLFATRRGLNGGSGGGELITLTDNSGYNGAFTGSPTVIVSVAVTDKMGFRGIALVPQNCNMVNGLQAVDITPTQATLSWNTADPGTIYEYAITTAATPTFAGTTTTNTSFTATALVNGTTYYAHVRTRCGALYNSDWSTVSFVAGCKPPPVASVHIATAPAATMVVQWNKVLGATGYEYAVSASATPPVSGTATSDTSVNIKGLNAVTSYYIHIRTNCGIGGFSTWTTKPFTTGCFIPAVNVQVMANSMFAAWNKISNAVKYEYALTYTTARPTSGAYTTDTSFVFDKAGKVLSYYFQVRSVCATGAVSAWSAVQFNWQGLQVYPNPVQGVLKITLPGINNAAGDITVSDAMGRTVHRIKVAGAVTAVDTQRWTSGIYFIRYSDGKNTAASRIMKQ